MVEINRSRRAGFDEGKLTAYDALLVAGMQTERYRHIGEPPVLLFACVDEAPARALTPRTESSPAGS